MKNKHTKYYTNKTIQKKIDRLLSELNTIVCNHETKSKYDIGDNRKKRIKEIEDEIKTIDPMFHERICPYGYLDS